MKKLWNKIKSYVLIAIGAISTIVFIILLNQKKSEDIQKQKEVVETKKEEVKETENEVKEASDTLEKTIKNAKEKAADIKVDKAERDKKAKEYFGE